MAEPEGTAGVDAAGEVEAPIKQAAGDSELDMAAVTAEGEEGEEGEEAAEAEAPAAEPPRRRLVSELLEGQEVVEESSRRNLQIVAPPLHLETIDAGQPIYQLDLSSEEPQGVIVEPERPAAPPEDDAYSLEDGSARDIVKNMIMKRDRQVMAAERDGIGAYELATGLDAFVQKVVDVARTRD